MEIIQSKDYRILAKLNEHVQNIHSELFPNLFKEHNLDEMTSFFKTVVENSNHLFLLVKDENEFVGYAWIEIKEYPESIFKKAYTSVYIHQISINSNKRNKGYGSFLIHKIASFAREHNVLRVELDYWSDNKMAKDFYEKLGFIKYREHVYLEV